MPTLFAKVPIRKRVGKPSTACFDRSRGYQRQAQFLLDFVEAENSTGFHAPQEAERILAESLNYSRQGQLAVRDPKFVATVPIVDLPPPAPSAAPAAKPK